MSVNWASIGSGNGLSPIQLQTITWTNAGLLSIGLLKTNFNEIWIRILSFLLKKMHFKMLSTNMAAILFRGRWFEYLYLLYQIMWSTCEPIFQTSKFLFWCISRKSYRCLLICVFGLKLLGRLFANQRLTHCGLVIPYSVIKLGPLRFR